MKNEKSYLQVSVPANIMMNIFFIIYSLLCILPLLLIVSISLTDEEAIAINGYSFIPSKFSTQAYKFVLRDFMPVLRAYGITIFVTVVGTIMCVLVVSLYAYVISRKDFKYKNGFSFFVFFTMLFNGGFVPWYIVCVNVLHLKDSIWALILPYVMNAWYVLIMRTFFTMSIPDSIIESAKIDGAGEWTTFFRIVIPLAKPGLATIGLFAAITYWNDWWLPLTLIDSAKYWNLQYTMYKVQQDIKYIAEMASQMGGQAGEILKTIPQQTSRMAMCVIAIGPIILAYPYFQKYFVKGLTIGAIKG